MSRRGIGGLAQAIALAALLTSGSAQDGARRFESILWLHGGPARDAAFYAAVKAAGYSAVSVSGGEDPAGPGRHGMPYYHDQ